MARQLKGEGSIHRYKSGWRATVVINGKRVERTAATKTEAAKIRRELLGQAAVGVTPTGWTVKTWTEHWLTAIADLTPATMKGYRSTLDCHLYPAVGHIKLGDLQPEHLEALYKAMKDGTYRQARRLKNGKLDKPRPLAGNTIGQTHAVIRRSLTVAQQRGHVARNVARLVEPPKRGKPKTTTLSKADAVQVLRAAVETEYPARWALALMYGVRPAEALGLSWDCLAGNRLTIDRQLVYSSGKLVIQPMAKTDAGNRVIVLDDEVVELLKLQRSKQLAQMLDSDWKEWTPNGWDEPVLMMFTMRDGSPVKPRHDATLWARLLVAAGVPHTRRYTARHTAATLMLALGSEIAVVSETLGHRDTSFTYRTYVHALEDAKSEQAKRMSALLSS